MASWPFPGPRSATLVACLSLTEISALWLRGLSFWSNQGLGVATQLALATLIILWWTSAVWGGYWYLRGVSRLCRVVTTKSGRGLVICAAALPLAVAANLYLLEWLYYWRLGTFPDVDALHFAGLNCHMLVKYFWQAERVAWVSCLAVCGIVVMLCVLAVRATTKRNDLLQYPRGIALRQGLVLIAVVNAAVLSMDQSERTGDPFHSFADRAQATLNQHPPYSFELAYHVNPGVAALNHALMPSRAAPKGDIPLEALTPLGKIRPSTFPEISPEARRNIVLIVIESLRSDVILKEQDGIQVLPNVAQLARSGRFFPNCYANSTSSDCTDPCIVSSLYPLRTEWHHFYRRQDPWPKVLIYDLLKQYGYSTAIFSSQNETWSNMNLFYESPHLDVFFDSTSRADKTIAGSSIFNKWLSDTRQVAGKLDDALTIGAAIDWIGRQQAAGQPFFVSINLQTSHFPYERPDGKQGPFHPGKLPSGTPFMSCESPETILVMRNVYQNALHYLDSQIGRLLQMLRRTGLDDRTIVLVTGDHGEAFCENGVTGHGQRPVETILKTGLVIHAPGCVDAVHDEQLASAVDIVPTALGLLGLPRHPAFQGIDLLGEDSPDSGSRLVFIHCSAPSMQIDAVISGSGWKLTRDHLRDFDELYFRPQDLDMDPNLIADEPQIARCLGQLLADWRGRQLLYYSSARYYSCFYPPRPPQLSVEYDDILKQ